ncbi:MAG: CHAD domain-containing protein [Solirubrobacteraceae bacterium]
MTDLLAPEGMTLEAAAPALALALPVRDGGLRESDRAFYDTFDGLLYAAGLLAVHERGRLALVERDGAQRASGRERISVSLPRLERPLLALELEPGPLREALSAVAGVRALLALVQVHSRVRSLAVLDSERKTVVRLTLEAPALVSLGVRRRALRPRIRCAVVRGYDSELVRVVDVLQHELGFLPAEQALVDEAVSAAGGDPAGTSSKIDVAVNRRQRADEATVAVLGRLREIIEANLEGTIADVDSEFLHDFRVSVRRSRAVQRQCQRVFPPAELAHFRDEFRWLQQVTGEARDLDVYVLEFESMRALVPEPMRAELEPLLGVLRSRRLIVRREMVRGLRSERTPLLLADWSSFLERLVCPPQDGSLGLVDTGPLGPVGAGALDPAGAGAGAIRPGEDGPDAGRGIADLAGEQIRKLYRRMVRMGRAIDDDSPPEVYHELRKKGKELRYVLELFGSLYPSDAVKPMIKSLKALQDTLGRHQDREIQRGMLRSLRDEVAALPGGPGALMAMGVLVERLGEDERAARNTFAERFAVFASKEQRKLIKETFS